MQGASCYYMRPTSVFFLILTTGIIVASYFSFPANLDAQLFSYYAHYWHLLIKLFLVTLFYLIYAFAIEQKDRINALYHHLISAGCIIGICWVFLKIIKFVMATV